MIYIKKEKKTEKKKKWKNKIKKICHRKANTKIIVYNILYIQSKYSRL